MPGSKRHLRTADRAPNEPVIPILAIDFRVFNWVAETLYISVGFQEYDIVGFDRHAMKLILAMDTQCNQQ